MHLEERIKKLENEIIQLKYALRVHQFLLAVESVPDWAKEATTVAKELGLIDNPYGGSLDFYRLITLMYQCGAIPKPSSLNSFNNIS